MKDTSKRKSTEETISNPESFFRQVIENAGGVPFQLIFGPSFGTGYYKYIGTGIKDLLGVPSNEFSEKLFGSLVEEVNPLLPEIPIDPAECRRKMVKGDIPHYKADILIRTRKGELKWINDSSLPIRDEKTDKIIGAQGILIDIDERKRIEKGTEQNISLLRATLESTADGILVVESSGKISDFNNQFAQMWRIPDAILATHDDKQAIDFVLDQLKDPKSFVSKVEELYANPEKESYDLLEFKDGRYFERFSHPQKIAGKPVGRVWSFRDVTEQRRSEESLRESEEQFRTLADQSPNMIFINKKGKVVYANRKCEEMMGFTIEEFLSPSFDFRLIIAPESQGLVQQVFGKHLRGEEVLPYEYGLLTRDGKIINSIITSKLINYLGERAILGIITDITERKQTEIILRQSEEKYKKLFDEDLTGNYISTPQGELILCNAAYLKMFEFDSLADAIAYDVKKLYQKQEDRDKFIQILKQNKKVESYELKLVTKKGRIINVIENVIADFDKDGNITQFHGYIYDITERKRAEESLRRSETRLQTLFSAINDVILVIDAEGRYIEIAPTNPSLLYKPANEVLGKTVYEVFPNAQADFFLEKIRLALGSKQPINIEYSLPIGNEEIWFSATLSPMSSTSVLLIARDINERKRAEKTLRESEERYRSLFDKMMDGVYRSTHEGKFVDVNDAMVKMFGFSSKEEMLKVDIKKELYFAPSERDSLFLDTGQEKIEVFRMRRKDGSEIWVEDHGHYVHDQQGNVIYHEGILRNVTERLRTEVLQNAIYQISQGADKVLTLDELFKSVHQIISTVMPAKNFYISLYDKEKDLLTFPYFVDEVDISAPPVNPGKGLTAYVLRTGKPLLCDEATDIKLRQQGDVELVGAPSSIWLGVPLIVNNKTIGVMVIQHYSDPHAYNEQDLHMLEYVSSQVAKAIDHKRSEEKLRQSEEQFRLISENIADLIAVLDLNGKRVYSSPSYKNILGEPESLRSTDSFQEIHPEDRDRIKQIFQETVKTGVGQRAEYRFLLKDGRIRHIESQGSIIKDKEGKISQVVVVSRDVTEKKILEQQFLRSQRMESIGTLAGGIAHDLNNVLAPIVMAIDILKKKTADKTSLQMLDTLESSAQRGADIVKQVLAFARGIEGERILLQPKHLIGEVVKIIKETFPRSIDIRTEVPKNLWTISADPTQIHQVLLNICVNARDAMPDGGKLTISAENIFIDENYSKMHSEAKAGPTTMITISDTGTGIPPKILDKIFEPFFTTKEIGKGTGLGLSTVHAIVKSHGGFINVYSDVGQGTTFKIYFPAKIEDQASLTDILHPVLPQGNGELILIVDDEATIRDITRSTLETNGYHVITANDGTEAIGLYAQNRENISIVISDIMMPVMDGIVTIRALQKMNPNIKIIAASGLITSDVKNLGAQVQAFLTKPFSAEKLLITIHKVLNS